MAAPLNMRATTMAPSSEGWVFALAFRHQACCAPLIVSCAPRILAFRGEVARPSASLPPKSEAFLQLCHRCHMKRGRFPAPTPRQTSRQSRSFPCGEYSIRHPNYDPCSPGRDRAKPPASGRLTDNPRHVRDRSGPRGREPPGMRLPKPPVANMRAPSIRLAK